MARWLDPPRDDDSWLIIILGRRVARGLPSIVRCSLRSILVFNFASKDSPERILAGLRTHVNFQMLYKKYAVFHFLSWIVGLLINVGTVTPYASVERVDLDLLFGLRAPWLGADVALSIRINRSSYIWVWGDTLVGNLYADGDRNISSMVLTHFHCKCRG